MRSTLLFVAVLLACTPGHAHATLPSRAPIFSGNLAALFTAPATMASRSVRANHQSARAIASVHHQNVSVFTAPPASTQSASDETVQSVTLLLHDPNAP